MHAYLVTPGFEGALLDELGSGRVDTAGVVLSDRRADAVFARQLLPDAAELRGASVRAQAEAAYGAIERAIDAWPGPHALHVVTPADIHPDIEVEAGLPSRATLAGRALAELLAARRKRASRRQAAPAGMADFDERWLLVQILVLSRDRLLVSAASPRALPRGGADLSPWPAGVAPVEIDRAPPSRAYQKLEEAFAWMASAPAAGELCVDLGAAPGGWTMTALKRGARVVAVDRAPLDVKKHPHLVSVIGNAFNYEPTRPADWLLSDVVCEPARALGLINRWLSNGWCRNLVVTVKFKGRAGYGALSALPPVFERLRPAFARAKQLAHNKNEVCVMVRGASS